jgi:hypothetical protein
MRGVLTSFAALAFLLLLTNCSSNQNTPDVGSLPSENDAVSTYERLLSYVDQGDRLLYPNNLTGRIVWNEQYFMESLLNMYQVTGEKRYLNLFVQHADHVLSQKDDIAGRTDSEGRSRPGWQVGSYYTLGVPVVIPDDEGSPSLEVQGIRLGGNNHTTIEIVRKRDQFDLIVKNDFRREEPVIVYFENLTLPTVEIQVNAHLSPGSYIRVKVLGDHPPAAGIYPLRETYREVLHELHTPLIGIPFLRFAAIVFENNLKQYEEKAKEYINAFEESYHDYEDSWCEDAEGGYLIFAPDRKFWAAGLPVPYNGLSANGRFLLWLYRVTGKFGYLEKAAKLAHKIKAGMHLLPDGTMTMPYWYGLPYQGWRDRKEAPINNIYVESKPFDGTEDISHFSLTLQFMVDAYYIGLVFEDDDIIAVANTFLRKIWKPGGALSGKRDWRQGIFLARNLDGEGRAYDYAAGAFALLAPWEPNIMQKAFTVYKERYLNPATIDLDYKYGYVLMGWSILALQMKGER